MTKKTVAEASAELYRLLEPFGTEERSRIVRGTLTLLGDVFPDDRRQEQTGKGPGAAAAGNARAFFEQKKPNNKIVELATAARFREQAEGASKSSKDELQKILSDARRNFDSHHFRRDIGNATHNGFFNKGGSVKSGYTLSYYGQNFIDALPDREAAKKIPRPKRGTAKRTKKPPVQITEA
jgi:hypothetical protein